MKKYFFAAALSLAALGTVTSCDDRNNDVQYVNNDDYAAVAKDFTGNFVLDRDGEYKLIAGISLVEKDVVLVYRNYNSNTNQAPVWQLLPKTVMVDKTDTGRKIEYHFLFDIQNVEVYNDALNFDLANLSPAEKNLYMNNQTFRIVIVPAKAGKTNINYEDYEAVAKYYGIKEVQTIKAK